MQREPDRGRMVVLGTVDGAALLELLRAAADEGMTVCDASIATALGAAFAFCTPSEWQRWRERLGVCTCGRDPRDLLNAYCPTHGRRRK